MILTFKCLHDVICDVASVHISPIHQVIQLPLHKITTVHVIASNEKQCISCTTCQFTFQSPALALLRDLDRDLDLDLEREAAAGLSRLALLSRVRLTDQIRCLVSTNTRTSAQRSAGASEQHVDGASEVCAVLFCLVKGEQIGVCKSVI